MTQEHGPVPQQQEMFSLNQSVHPATQSPQQNYGQSAPAWQHDTQANYPRQQYNCKSTVSKVR